jgi:fido (protein-threonine AMPylation protein)
LRPEIDRLVHELYDLTEEEIKIVEAASVASSKKVKENDSHDERSTSAGEPHPSQRQVAPMAPAARRPGDEAGLVSRSGAGVGGGIDEIRERTGDYGPPPGTPGKPEDHAPGSLGSTRYVDTVEGPKPYTEVAERLAVSLVNILQQIIDSDPVTLDVTSKWLCLRHRELAGTLFPDWAGRFRDRDVQIGMHHPPPFYEVPVQVRLFCDDLAERLRHIQSSAPDIRVIAELLAVADGRFQSIHPFRDFNGRVGRMLLVALLHMLGLPPVEIVPAGPEFRQAYLEALAAADQGDYGRLTEMWLRRLAEAL